MNDGFVLMFPCFAIESANGKGGVVQPFDDGTVGFVLLTDEDLLERYRNKFACKGLSIRFDGDEDLAGYMEILPPAVTHVAIDPGEASARVYPVASLKAQLWQRIQNREIQPQRASEVSEMETWNFGTSEKLLRFIQEKSDDIEGAVIFCHDFLQLTLPDGRMIGPLPSQNVGMVITFVGKKPVMLTKADAALVLNDGILNRMKIKIEIK